MHHLRKHAGRFAALALCGLLLCGITRAFAQDQSMVVEPQAAPPLVEPALPVPGPAVESESIPVPTVTGPVVHPAPPVAYHAGPRARRMMACHAEVNLVMVTKNPANCCLYEIPLCVPACCEGQPAVREGRGIFGRGVVEYCWPCGFTATVKFRPVHRDVKVNYSIQ